MKTQSAIRYAAAGLLAVVATMTFTPQAHASKPAAIMATVSGGGTANMDDGEGPSLFGMNAQLLSDGSARGHFECVDQQGDTYPGNFFGQVTSWSVNANGDITFSGVAKNVGFPPTFFFQLIDNIPFTVTIQSFGGPDVGHWTLDVPDFGGVVCFETIVSGQIVIH